jgi:hypothetical protein
VATLVSGVGLVVDDRILVGSPIWHKPLKFGISLGIYGVTLAWLHARLTRFRRTSWWAGTVIALAGTIEMAIITGQVVRGKRSHFNVATPLDETLFVIMANTIVVLWVAQMVIAALLFRQPLADRATSWAVRIGSVIAIVGLGFGFTMTTPTEEQRSGPVTGIVGAHSVGVPDGGPHLPVTGWAATGGDLRVAHFVGMHALQVLPLLALGLALAARRYGWAADTGVRPRLVLIAGAGYAGLMALTAWQALRGQPLTSPDAVTLGAAAALLAAVAAATALTLRRPRGPRAEAPEPPLRAGV